MSKQLSVATLAITLTALTASSVYAKVNCKTFKDEVKVNEQIVLDFSYGMEKIKTKLITIENKISDRMQLVDSVESRITDGVNTLEQISNQQDQLQQSTQGMRNQIISKQIKAGGLDRMIRSTQYQIDNLPAGSSARRQVMRENMRSKKSLERVIAALNVLEQQMMPIQGQISQLKNDKVGIRSELARLEMEKQDVQNMKPTLNVMRRIKRRAQDELANQDEMQQENMNILADAQEKVLMCKTYNVKYPIALDVAKEIYAVGCENYQTRGLQGKHKRDAEDDALDTICN